jgi:hypothetical protein
MLAAVGVFAAVSGIHYGLRDDAGAAGPGMLPSASGAVIAVLSVLLAWRTLRANHAVSQADDAGPARSESADEQPDKATRPWTVVAVTACAMLLVPVTGLLIALGVLIFAITAVVERQRPVIALTASAATVVVLYLIFDRLLGVPLPHGLFDVGF